MLTYFFGQTHEFVFGIRSFGISVVHEVDSHTHARSNHLQPSMHNNGVKKLSRLREQKWQRGSVLDEGRTCEFGLLLRELPSLLQSHTSSPKFTSPTSLGLRRLTSLNTYRSPRVRNLARKHFLPT